MTTENTAENTATTKNTVPADFVRKQKESGSVLVTNDPRDFLPKVQEDGTRLNARTSPRGEPDTEVRRAFDALKASMLAENGNLQPIGVEVVNSLARGRDPSLPRGYVVWGERRWAAAMDLFSEGHAVILKYITVSKDVDQLTAMALENLARYDLSQVEKSEFVKKLRAAGKTVDDICRICGRSAGWVDAMELLSSDKVAPETRQAARDNLIPTDVALELARQVPADQQGAAINEILANSKTKGDARRAVAEITGKSPSRPGKKQVSLLMERLLEAEIPAKAKMEIADLPTIMACLLEWTAGKLSDKSFKARLVDIFGDAVDLHGCFGSPSSFNKKANGGGTTKRVGKKAARRVETATPSPTRSARPEAPTKPGLPN